MLDMGKGYQSRNIDDEIARMSQMQQMLEQKKMEMEQSRSQITSPQQSRTPIWDEIDKLCLLYTSPSPRDRTRSRMPSSA